MSTESLMGSLFVGMLLGLLIYLFRRVHDLHQRSEMHKQQISFMLRDLVRLQTQIYDLSQKEGVAVNE